MSLLQEFKKFALKGNVIDMAVGIVIGASFTKIVNSLVGDVITPLIGAITSGKSVADEFIWFGPSAESARRRRIDPGDDCRRILRRVGKPAKRPVTPRAPSHAGAAHAGLDHAPGGSLSARVSCDPGKSR